MMRSKATTLLIAVLLGAATGAAQTGSTSPPRIRPLDDRATKAMDTGVRRSPTFRSLVDQLERSDVVVYVYTTPHLSQYVSGGLSFVGVSATMRFVKIALDLDLTSSQAVYILAHELQHALEIARAPRVRTRESFEAFYRHIDIGGALRHTFETAAAQLTGQQVRRELRANPGTPNDPRR